MEAQKEDDECRRLEAGASGLVVLEVGVWEGVMLYLSALIFDRLI